MLRSHALAACQDARSRLTQMEAVIKAGYRTDADFTPAEWRAIQGLASEAEAIIQEFTS